MDGSLRNMPSPEQGASIRILSNQPGKQAASRSGSSLQTRALPIPNNSRFFNSAFALEALTSLETRIPCPFKAAPRAVLFPPGAAHGIPGHDLPALPEAALPAPWHLAPVNNKGRKNNRDGGKDLPTAHTHNPVRQTRKRNKEPEGPKGPVPVLHPVRTFPGFSRNPRQAGSRKLFLYS